MYSTRRSPGKFEGNESQLTAQILYNVVGEGFVSDEYGEVDGPDGWNGIIRGTRYGFLLHEDNQGFFSYQYTSLKEADARWAKFVTEAEELDEE